MTEPLLQLQGLSIHFGGGFMSRRSPVKAVDGVNLEIKAGEVVALVGESGCGKTTVGKTVAGLIKPSGGSMLYRGRSLASMDKAAYQEFRRNVQLVHQDSFAALNPMRTVFETLSAPLQTYRLIPAGKNARTVVAEFLEMVDLTPVEQFLDKYPHQLSGGQRQRVVLARALTVRPSLIVADEPVSMVDVSLRLSLLDLMGRMNRDTGVAFLYITHDLATARYLAGHGRLAVMYLGKLVELGPVEEVISQPRHPYLQALLSAVPVPDPRMARQQHLLPLKSLEMPDPTKPPAGCRFHPRCPYATDLCEQRSPELTSLGGSHLVACHHEERIPAWTPYSGASPSAAASSSSSSR